MAWGGKVHKKYFTFNGAPTKQECYTQTGAYPSLYDHCLDRSAPLGQRWLYWNGTSFVPDPELNKQETITIPTQPPSSSGSIYVEPTGGDDTANLQAAINSGRPIHLTGKYKTTKDLTIPKDRMALVIHGNRAIIEGFGIKRVAPVDNNEALNVMVAAQYHVNDLTFKGGTFEPGPTYGSTFNNLKFEGSATGLHLRFCLGAQVNNCYFINCTKGLIIDHGNWSGANNFNSQSNHTQVLGGRFYGYNTSQVGIGIYGASGCSVKNFIIEGFGVTTGIEWDAKGSNVVKDFTIENVHYECPNGGSEFIKLRMTGNDIVTIKKCFGQYPVKFLDASSTSGLSYIEIANVPWWRGAGDTTGSNGKGVMFKTSNVTLHFEKNHAFNNIHAGLFDGPMPINAGAEGTSYAAYHTYTLNKINPS